MSGSVRLDPRPATIRRRASFSRRCIIGITMTSFLLAQKSTICKAFVAIPSRKVKTTIIPKCTLLSMPKTPHGRNHHSPLEKSPFTTLKGVVVDTDDPLHVELSKLGINATDISSSSFRALTNPTEGYDPSFGANSGDSRTIVVRRGGKVKALSRDHKPGLPEETRRITELGVRSFIGGGGGLRVCSPFREVSESRPSPSNRNSENKTINLQDGKHLRLFLVV